MNVLKEEVRRTYSVCPVCLRRIPAVREEKNGEIVLTKNCPEHGRFSSVIWRNRIDFAEWRGDRPAVKENENRNCPTGCGLCPEHLRSTCCTLLEITGRCNMNCTFCFADPGGEPEGERASSGRKEPDMSQIRRWIDDLTVPGKTLLQLSGGEPTVREDLPEIVAYAKQAGCKYVQLNSNGLRLAEDEAFVKKLADAGLSFVFMQFDGVEDGVYEKLRRHPMLEIKKKAIEHCGKYGIGVTLVPVIVPGVNVDQIGDIIRFAVERSPYVRGVHFQPVSYFGRVPKLPKDEDRFTLDELMDEAVRQSGGLLKMEDLAPSCCDHPMCGFHGDFIVMPDRTLMALASNKSSDGNSGCCCGTDPAEKNREFVGRRWERREETEAAGSCCCGEETEAAGSCCCGEAEAAENCCCGEKEAAESCCCGEETEAAGSCCCGETEAAESCCCGETETAGSCCCAETENAAKDGCSEEDFDITSMEGFLRRVRTHGFTITSMAFQDAGTLDIERLRQCSLHVYKDGKHIPFCAYYLSPMGVE